MSPPDTPLRSETAASAELCARAAPGELPEQRSPKPYRRPRLVAYGRLTDVTQFGGSQVVDSGAGLGQQV